MSFNGRNEFVSAMCTGKVVFDSHAAAARVQKRYRKGRDRERREREPYRCDICRLWHLGSKAQRQRPKREWKRYRARYEAAE